MIDKYTCKQEFESAMASTASIYEDVRKYNMLRAIAYGLAWVATVLEDARENK